MGRRISIAIYSDDGRCVLTIGCLASTATEQRGINQYPSTIRFALYFALGFALDWSLFSLHCSDAGARCELYMQHRKHKRLTQCWCNAEPAS